MSLIQAPDDWIVIDPLTTEATAKAALEAMGEYISQKICPAFDLRQK